ncbi:MAG: hypothetical protein K1X87_12100 [Dehalococcoidia bacterium]|nr:hypothetical protein [Dehalococcoidia bacterium]
MSNTFLGFDDQVNARYDPDAVTAFRVVPDEREPYGEIVFGPDIYPGRSVVDPNSALSMEAAVAHELTHHYRWLDKTQVSEADLEHLDEALTSLQAIGRYRGRLKESAVYELVTDAVTRLSLYLDSLR